MTEHMVAIVAIISAIIAIVLALVALVCVERVRDGSALAFFNELILSIKGAQ